MDLKIYKKIRSCECDVPRGSRCEIKSEKCKKAAVIHRATSCSGRIFLKIILVSDEIHGTISRSPDESEKLEDCLLASFLIVA